MVYLSLYSFKRCNTCLASCCLNNECSTTAIYKPACSILGLNFAYIEYTMCDYAAF